MDVFLADENARKAACLVQMSKMCVTGLAIPDPARDF